MAVPVSYYFPKKLPSLNSVYIHDHYTKNNSLEDLIELSTFKSKWVVLPEVVGGAANPIWRCPWTFYDLRENVICGEYFLICNRNKQIRMSIKAFDLVPAIERIKLMSDKAKTQVNIVIVVTVIENFKEYTRSFILCYIVEPVPDYLLGLTGWSLEPHNLGNSLCNIFDTVIGLAHIGCH